ncbi:MAG TPA: hypothetical protein PLM82_13000 [Candidatus Latescibacteria bacterium]|nr:hypothetical protein [Candidatus Latescibacterota bacterium]
MTTGDEMNDDNVYFWIDSLGGINGPETRSRLQDLYRQKIVSDDTKVSIRGSKEWFPYKTLFCVESTVPEFSQLTIQDGKGGSSVIREPCVGNQDDNGACSRTSCPPKFSKRNIGLITFVSIVFLIGVFWFSRAIEGGKRSYDINIEGSVFIALKNGTNIKLGLVPVRVFDSHALHTCLILALHPIITPSYLIDMESWCESESDAYVEFTNQVDELQIMSQGARKLAWNKLLGRIAGRHYVLPQVVSGAITDADGKFKMSVPPSINIRLPLIDAEGNCKMSSRRVGKCSLVAIAERQVFDTTERYLWIIPLSSEPNQTLTLANHNMIEDIDELFDVIQRGEGW